jgi:hypothetical protein
MKSTKMTIPKANKHQNINLRHPKQSNMKSHNKNKLDSFLKNTQEQTSEGEGNQFMKTDKLMETAPNKIDKTVGQAFVADIQQILENMLKYQKWK